MIPDDILSDELLSNEEFDPNNLNFRIGFVQDFYQLCLLLCPEAQDSEEFKKTVNDFLIKKVESFQKQFSDSFGEEHEEEYHDYSYKQYVYAKRREDAS